MFSSLNTLFGNEIVSLPNVFYLFLLNHIWRQTISLPKPFFFFNSTIFGDEIFRC